MPLALFLGAFIIYNLNLRTIRTLDSLPTSLLPFSLIYNHNIYLDQFVKALQPDGTSLYFWGNWHGHWFSAYPLLLSFMIAPLYWIALNIFSINLNNIKEVLSFALFMEKISASLITALSVAFMYVLLKKMTSNKLAMALSLVYGFATNTWATSSQALWQHGLSQLLIILALLAFYLAKEKNNYLYLSGLFISLAVAERNNDLIPAVLLLGFVLYMYKSKAIKFALPGLIVGSLLITYHLSVWGTMGGNYGAFFVNFTGSILDGLPYFFFNVNRGLFVYSPVLIFGLFGIIVLLKNRKNKETLDKSIYYVSLASIAIGVILISRLADLSGGPVFGPRLSTDLIPFFIILMVPAIEQISITQFKSKSFIITCLCLLTIFSIFVQTLGAFYYTGTDGIADQNLLDWRNSQIVKVYKRGFALSPYHEFAFNRGWLKQNPALLAEARNAQIIIKGKKVKMKIGQMTNFRIQIINKSKIVWPKGWESSKTASLLLSNFWINKKSEVSQGYSKYILKSVASGQKIDLDYLIEAPATPGTYTLKFDLQQEQVAWFNQPKEIKVTISDLR